MGIKRAAIAIAVGICIGLIFKSTKNDRKSEGNVHNHFESVKQSFDDMLVNEKEGLALASYRNGELIVDLWGGYAERAANRAWKRETMTVAFSSTKLLGALIIAIMVSRDNLRYEDLVVKYWPEFGANGKENTTILWIVEHKAGLIKFDGELSIEQAKDHNYVAKLIENTKPMWEPGTEVGYHAITYGWLLDQIVRRADPEKRSLAQFYRDEVVKYMKDQDFYLGLPRDQHYRMARIVQPTLTELIKALATNLNYLHFLFLNLKWKHEKFLMFISGKWPRWMSVISFEMPYNDPEVQEIENVAALGIGTARGLASAVSTIIEKKLISEKVWKRIKEPTGWNEDIVTTAPGYRGYGFLYEPHPIRPNCYIIFHAGHGFQNLLFDLKTKIVVAMVRNAIEYDVSLLQKSMELSTKIIKIANEL